MTSEIKPVAWRWKEDGGGFMYGDTLPMSFNRSRHSWQQLYTADAIEALQAECARLREEKTRLHDHCDKISEELAAAQKDAKRYRYAVREDLIGKHKVDSLGDCQCYFDSITTPAIDAAMEKEKRDE